MLNRFIVLGIKNCNLTQELVALGEAVGTHSKGLKADVIASLPCYKFVSSSTNSEDP